MSSQVVMETLKTVTSGRHVSREKARETVRAMLEGEVSDELIAGILVALKMKGESAPEVAGFAEGMRDVQVPVRPSASLLVDTCGTGGDGMGTFNISTTAALIAAGAGASVAKHGNRNVSSQCGSADVLSELGVNVDSGPERVTECIERVGIGFLFAPSFNPAMKRVMKARTSLGIPTIFNVLGPLTNPAGAGAHVIGVNRRELIDVIGEVLCELGTERSFVLHGRDGMDEFSLASDTIVCEVRGCERSVYALTPEDLGFKRCEACELAGGDSSRNAEIVREVLAGVTGARTDAAVANAAFALVAGGAAGSLVQGVRLARSAVETGEAMRKLEMLVAVSNGGDAHDSNGEEEEE